MAGRGRGRSRGSTGVKEKRKPTGRGAAAAAARATGEASRGDRAARHAAHDSAVDLPFNAGKVIAFPGGHIPSSDTRRPARCRRRSPACLSLAKRTAGGRLASASFAGSARPSERPALPTGRSPRPPRTRSSSELLASLAEDEALEHVERAAALATRPATSKRARSAGKKKGNSAGAGSPPPCFRPKRAQAISALGRSTPLHASRF